MMTVVYRVGHYRVDDGYRYWPDVFATLDDAHQAIAEFKPAEYERLYWKLTASGVWSSFLSAGIEAKYRIERSDADGVDI